MLPLPQLPVLRAGSQLALVAQLPSWALSPPRPCHHSVRDRRTDGRVLQAEGKAWAGRFPSKPPASSSTLPPALPSCTGQLGLLETKIQERCYAVPTAEMFLWQTGNSSSCPPLLSRTAPLPCHHPSALLPALAGLILLRALRATVCLPTPGPLHRLFFPAPWSRQHPPPQAHFGFLPRVPLCFGHTCFRAHAVSCQRRRQYPPRAVSVSAETL